MNGGFRTFLQSLKPGEIGFVIASVGASSAAVLTINSFQSKQDKIAADQRKEWKKVTAHVKQLVSEGTPIEGLSTIKFYQARLREEARLQVGIENATTDEINDEWVRRRNKGDGDALKIEHTRLRLKRFWHSIESAAEYRNKIYPKEQKERVLKDLLNGGLGTNQANDRLVQKTLMFLERLDLATCRNHPNCRWERDAPSFYSFLRDQFEIPIEWPEPDTNVDDFSIGAPKMNTIDQKKLYNTVPKTRVAQLMEKRWNRRGVWEQALGGVEKAIELEYWGGTSNKKGSGLKSGKE